jgi:nucleotide-binding universal stress UspA family protein
MKVILAVDGSPCSEAAVSEAATRLWPDGTEIMVLSAVRVPIPETSDPLFFMAAAHVEMMEAERRRMETLAEGVANRLRDTATGTKVKILSRVIEGSPKEVIVGEAERWQADVILIGCHGFGYIKRFLLGSVSQAVAAHAPCSVHIARARHPDAK